LKLDTGILVTNPIAEADQVDPKKHEKVLQAALKKPPKRASRAKP